MKRTLFEFLKARPLNDPVDVESLEKEYGINLPPIYKVFVESFYLGEKHLYREYFYNKKNREYDCSAYIYTPNENVGFSHFVTIEDCFDVWKNGTLSDYEIEQGYFPIAGGDYTISVGLKNEYKDKIIMLAFGGDNYETILCDNIFEFVRGIEILELEEEFMGGVKYSQLYKNYGDEIWSVRED